MYSGKYTFVLLLFCLSLNTYAFKIVEAIALEVDGYKIPIKIYLPENTSDKHPIHFYIHGGGWNGGTKTEVPPATISGDANYLCDRLGIIYVGLAYRCKGNDGTFKKAISDLETSVKWFLDRAESFDADTTRIGFGGSSAGSTLSSVMAQKYKNCKLYIGNEGMYNVVDLDETLSHFPDAKSRADYGLSDLVSRKEASAYYNLRKNPPATLLLQGKQDWLCHYSQSKKFADKIKNSGGKSKVVYYDSINHTCLNPNYPEVFKNSVIEIAHHFTNEFHLKGIDFKAIEKQLFNALKKNYPHENFPLEMIVGSWKDKRGTFTFKEDNTCSYVNKQGKQKQTFTYTKKEGCLLLKGKKGVRVFYMRKNNKVIYEQILQQSRIKGRRFNYRKV
ncbi:alpha/beta hydrolase [Ochrovirga pacifica]|uniref:alpha/beta hydrolase n=1 Tax=Ochrovirga pacifica TaxID=1042376 RepID=UPI000255A547|nr:alpha/beta hydrolase [Ochrovirga pacifica]